MVDLATGHSEYKVDTGDRGSAGSRNSGMWIRGAASRRKTQNRFSELPVLSVSMNYEHSRSLRELPVPGTKGGLFFICVESRNLT
jgi:hypothetical protein